MPPIRNSISSRVWAWPSRLRAMSSVASNEPDHVRGEQDALDGAVLEYRDGVQMPLEHLMRHVAEVVVRRGRPHLVGHDVSRRDRQHPSQLIVQVAIPTDRQEILQDAEIRREMEVGVANQ